MQSHIGLKIGLLNSPLGLNNFEASFRPLSANMEFSPTDENLWSAKYSIEGDATLGIYKSEDYDISATIGSLTAGANLYPLNFIEALNKPDSKFKIMPRIGFVGGYDYALASNEDFAIALPRRFFIGGKAGLKIGMGKFVAFTDVGYMPQAIVQFGMGYTLPY